MAHIAVAGWCGVGVLYVCAVWRKEGLCEGGLFSLFPELIPLHAHGQRLSAVLYKKLKKAFIVHLMNNIGNF